jgi:hypothetical protein
VQAQALSGTACEPLSRLQPLLGLQRERHEGASKVV